MEAVEVTLTDFLLARIAEDEKVARYETPHHPDCEHFHYYNEGGLPCTCGAEKRLLVECEAKRRIVDLFPSSPDGDGWNEAGGQVLAILALPYADHPDYRPEWKP